MYVYLCACVFVSCMFLCLEAKKDQKSVQVLGGKLQVATFFNSFNKDCFNNNMLNLSFSTFLVIKN